MLGAIIGDIAGSRFRVNRYWNRNFNLFAEGCFATADSIMTLAVAKAILACEGDWEQLGPLAIRHMQEIGQKFPDCGFNDIFHRWLLSDDPQTTNNLRNGAPVQASPCGFIASTEEEARQLAHKIAGITHNHKEGIKGAQAAAAVIFMARQGATKEEIREKIECDYYDLIYYLDEIRDDYEYLEICPGPVEQSIVAFFESTTFEDAVHNANSISRNNETIPAITGAIAEAYYGVPLPIKRKALCYLEGELHDIYRQWERYLNDRKPVRKFAIITKYIDKLEDEYNRDDLFEEFHVFIQSNPKFGLQDYQEILKEHGLKWTEESMKSADVDNLDEQGILALILGAYRAEHFSEGVLEKFISEGYFTKWLERLKSMDEERESETDKPVLKKIKICLQPFHKGNTGELLVTEKQIIIKNNPLEGGSVTHHYEIGAGSEHGEDSLRMMSSCLDTEDWHDIQNFQEIQHAINLYELEAEYEDGKTVAHRGVFDRAHIPEKAFTDFLEKIRMIVQSFGFGDILSLSGFKYALKKGEVKYCGVEFSGGGKLYHYRTTDLRIEVGDRVFVPVGSSNYEQEATVKTVEFCRWDETPYPLEKTKEIKYLAKDERKDSPPQPYLLGGVVTGEYTEDDEYN